MSAPDKVNILLVDDQPAKLLSYEVILQGLGENSAEGLVRLAGFGSSPETKSRRHTDGRLHARPGRV